MRDAYVGVTQERDVEVEFGGNVEIDLGGRGGSGREERMDVGDIGNNMIKIYYMKFSKHKNAF